MPIDKNYSPESAEAKWYAKWEKSGAFNCDPTSKAKPYCIMIPPPNITGNLHMGHGLTFTIQDTLIRYHRMKGFDTLWQPGTDHASIAVHTVLERQFQEQGTTRQKLGREKFLEEAWKWKDLCHGNITNQFRRLGASLDWPRERFTMDEGLNKAVLKVFVSLYREGLIYKDNRLVNWDPGSQTGISDLEVDNKEIKGNLWHFKYPIEGMEGTFITVATTRPETMLGDTAVAVHPENEKLKHLIGKNAILPLVGRRIPIIGDEYADPEKGTGAVKITPAHDFNDFEVGKRHNLPMINIMDARAHLNDEVPEKYRGLERFAARKMVVADMEALELLDKVEPHTHMVPHAERSGLPVEPWLSEQWFCDAHTLAQPAIKAVEEGRTKFFPQSWENTYFAWMRNIQPWCISRQLWWGHQIPAWYGFEKGTTALKIFVAETENEAIQQAEAHYGKKVYVEKSAVDALEFSVQHKNIESDQCPIWRDPDILDTWFSSALWPFSTLGWPEKTPELARYYPSDTLVTGPDIIFFWVARMMMMGLHFMGDVPFRDVYMHAIVRDEKGKKMSKTTGNVIDPLEMIEKNGCDALRFTMDSLATPGRSINLSTSAIEGNRNFATKLWNAARYCQMNEAKVDPAFNPAHAKLEVNKWIIGSLKQAVDKVGTHIEGFRFDLMGQTIYEFVWNTFCDWYLEFTKPILMGTDEAAKAETRKTTAWALTEMLKMMHPVMPYITEELWEQIVGDGTMLISTKWSELPETLVDENAKDEMDWVVGLISAIRAVRSELNVPAGAQIPMIIKGASRLTQDRIVTHEAILKRLARISSIEYGNDAPKGSAQCILGEATYILPLEDVIDITQERARLEKEIAKWRDEVKKIEAKLGNEAFVARAPEEVVEEHRERQTNAESMIEKLTAAMKGLL